MARAKKERQVACLSAFDGLFSCRGGLFLALIGAIPAAAFEDHLRGRIDAAYRVVSLWTGYLGLIFLPGQLLFKMLTALGAGKGVGGHPLDTYLALTVIVFGST